jgi:hypothetical protein
MTQWIQNFFVCKFITTYNGGTKVSGACYAIMSMVHISNTNTLKSIYFLSVIKYGLMLWGNSSNSVKIFTLQKNIVTIMAGAQPRPSCSVIKQPEILPVPCQYILSLMSFIINN